MTEHLPGRKLPVSGGEGIHMSRTAGRTPDADRGPPVLQAGAALLQAGGALLQAQQDKSQAQLQQSQRLENLGQLAGGIAHDFNNLLTVILNYVTFVSEEMDAATESDWGGRWEPARGALTKIKRPAKRAARLTHQLLAFARR